MTSHLSPPIAVVHRRISYLSNICYVIRNHLYFFRRAVKNSNDNADAVRVSCNNYYLFWRTLDPQDFPVLWCISPYEPLPAEATPSEITSRFHDVCVKAVNMICYSDTITSLPYDLELRHADFKLPSHFEKYKPADFCSLLRSSEIFTQWMFCLFVDFLDYALVSYWVV